MYSIYLTGDIERIRRFDSGLRLLRPKEPILAIGYSPIDLLFTFGGIGGTTEVSDDELSATYRVEGLSAGILQGLSSNRDGSYDLHLLTRENFFRRKSLKEIIDSALKPGQSNAQISVKFVRPLVGSPLWNGVANFQFKSLCVGRGEVIPALEGRMEDQIRRV